MPLIGFSAQFIPYVMAMIFTMIFLNGQTSCKAEKLVTSKKTTSGKHIFLTDNAGTIPSSFHFNSTVSSTGATMTSSPEVFYDDFDPLISSLYLIPLIPETNIQAFSLRGPPVS